MVHGENMGGVRCISTCLIKASSQNGEKGRVELTPWDLRLLLLGPIQKGLLLPKSSNDFVHRLKASLSRTLHYFPPLAGRLAATQLDRETVSFFIDCNNAGALFIHAKADGVTISDIVEPVYVPSIVHSFFPLNGMTNYDGMFQPLLGVQVTELADGVFLGCTINHSVADGTSFWHFINSWSEISRGSIQLSKPPIFQRPILDNIDYPIRIPLALVEHELIQAQPPLSLRERIFHFSKQSIAKLKEKANAEAGTNNISSLQALTSHLWRCIIRNKNLSSEEEMTYYLVWVGARPRLRNLPQHYFGNAVRTRIVAMKAKQVREQGVGDIAREMNKLISAQTEQEFTRDLESWIACPKLMTSASFPSNLTGTSSSPRFDVYGNDYGWGRPIAVRSGLGNKVDGKLTVFCGAEEGSIDVEACLLLETLEAMANDDEFVNTVTI